MGSSFELTSPSCSADADREGRPLEQVDVATVYLDENASSHFRPAAGPGVADRQPRGRRGRGPPGQCEPELRGQPTLGLRRWRSPLGRVARAGAVCRAGVGDPRRERRAAGCPCPGGRVGPGGKGGHRAGPVPRQLRHPAARSSRARIPRRHWSRCRRGPSSPQRAPRRSRRRARAGRRCVGSPRRGPRPPLDPVHEEERGERYQGSQEGGVQHERPCVAVRVPEDRESSTPPSSATLTRRADELRSDW